MRGRQQRRCRGTKFDPRVIQHTSGCHGRNSVLPKQRMSVRLCSSGSACHCSTARRLSGLSAARCRACLRGLLLGFLPNAAADADVDADADVFDFFFSGVSCAAASRFAGGCASGNGAFSWPGCRRDGWECTLHTNSSAPSTQSLEQARASTAIRLSAAILWPATLALFARELLLHRHLDERRNVATGEVGLLEAELELHLVLAEGGACVGCELHESA
jgi:hypothetical protein